MRRASSPLTAPVAILSQAGSRDCGRGAGRGDAPTSDSVASEGRSARAGDELSTEDPEGTYNHIKKGGPDGGPKISNSRKESKNNLLLL